MGYYILKPKNLDLESLLRKYPPNFDFNIDYAYLIINDIIVSTAYRLDIQRRNKKMTWESFAKTSSIKNFFLRMCSPQLQAFERDYNKHFKYLTENRGDGSILWKENYGEGKCYGFQLSRNYFYSELTFYIITDKKLIRKIRKSDRVVGVDNTGNKLWYLKKFFTPSRLTIDIEQAFKYNDTVNLQENRLKHFINAVKIVDIANGKYSFSLNPETDGRFHSSITRFPKELRRFLRYDGKKMSEIDISASVPFFFYYFLINISNTNKHIDSVLKPQNPIYIPYMLVKNELTVDNEEVERFGSAILGGHFYSDFVQPLKGAQVLKKREFKPFAYICWRVKKLFDKNCEGEKDYLGVAKKTILSMLNSRNGVYPVEESLFESLYASIFAFLRAFKSKKYIDASHKKFAHLMLQLESYFMVGLLPKKIFAKYKNRMPILTLHDCLITTSDKADELLSFMQNIFLNELGIVKMLFFFKVCYKFCVKLYV